MDVSGQSLQAMLTRDAKITSASFLSEVIFAFGGFVSGLSMLTKSTDCQGVAKARKTRELAWT